MKNIKIMLWYDVEDYINPEADDALLALIEMMDDLGIRSSLKFVGEKIRILQERKRTDVLAKLSGHEICYHTDSHSWHPTPSEYLNDLGFADGARAFAANEQQGFMDLQRISGQFPTSYGQPGASWVPQVFPVLRKWGVPTYLDEHDIISVEDKPFWYGGILNLTRLWATMRVEMEPGGLDAAKAEFDRICEKADAEQCQLVSIYYHPCEFSSTEFWDSVNYSRGINTPRAQWKASNARTRQDMHARVSLLKEFIEYTLEKPDVAYITVSEAAKLELIDHRTVSAADLQSMAARLAEGPDYYVEGRRSLCAAEVLSLFARFWLGKPLSPDLMYGPEQMVPSNVTGKIKISDLAQAVSTQFAVVFGYRQLPDAYILGDNRINPVDAFCTLRDALLQGLKADDRIQPVCGEGQLVCARHVRKKTTWGDSWIIFPEQLDVANLVRMAEMQAWTLKPALY